MPSNESLELTVSRLSVGRIGSRVEGAAGVNINRTSIKLIVEVVSTNWQDDYALKLVDYEALGVQEYWIADYAALGGRRYIGNPKQPTFTVCTLVDGDYELQPFRASEQIISRAFPLNLPVDEVFTVGR